MKIKIFARHCKFSSNSANKARPSWFTREGCFNSFLNTLDADCELNICFDGTAAGSGHFLENPKYAGKFKLYEKKGGNDAKSFLNLLDTVKSSDFSDEDILYFVEDDYLHNIGWTKILREGFKYIDVDYITLYDHNDKYFYPMYEELMSKVGCTPSTHWKTIPNTTNTYACLGKTFKRDFAIHVKYCDTERGLTRDFDKFAELSGSGRTLINPLPGYSTHCEPQYMSPVVNWEEVYNKTCNFN
jgi:hypothetical protein